MRFDASSLCSDKHYVCVFTTQHQGEPNQFVRIICNFDEQVVRGAEIIDALTLATRAEDIADAFSWVETSHPSAQETLQALRIRSTILDGSTMIPKGVPVSTRAFNDEVVYTMLRALCLEYHIQLTGLCGAAHLNDREGVLRGRDPSNHVRWRARLDDGKYVSVKAQNFVRIRRGDYKRRAQ
jgi:transcriptional regulator GlxA family with amidase domain